MVGATQRGRSGIPKRGWPKFRSDVDKYEGTHEASKHEREAGMVQVGGHASSAGPPRGTQVHPES